MNPLLLTLFIPGRRMESSQLPSSSIGREETTIFVPDTTTQLGPSAATHLVHTTSTTTGNCNEEKCQKECTGIVSCKNGGTCSCDATCTITCNCGSSYKGSRCEMGVNIFAAVLRQGAPKVIFDMTVKFGSADLEKSKQETMLHQQFQNFPGFNNVSVSPLNEGTTNDYPVKAMFDYNDNNINKVYNGGLKDEIKNTFGGQERASQGSMTLIGEINQTNVPRENLDLVFQCSTSYEGYIVSFNSTGVFCISPCNDTSYCNNRGNCSHLVSGPKCSCDTNTSDAHCKVEPKPTNLFKILFGTLGGLLGVGILLGIVCYCVKRQSPSKSLHLLNYDW